MSQLTNVSRRSFAITLVAALLLTSSPAWSDIVYGSFNNQGVAGLRFDQDCRKVFGKYYYQLTREKAKALSQLQKQNLVEEVNGYCEAVRQEKIRWVTLQAGGDRFCIDKPSTYRSYVYGSDDWHTPLPGGYGQQCVSTTHYLTGTYSSIYWEMFIKRLESIIVEKNIRFPRPIDLDLLPFGLASKRYYPPGSCDPIQ